MSQSLAQWLRVLRQAPALGGGRWRRLPGTLLVWRDAAPFVRIHFLAVATDLGLLEELRRRPATVDQLSDRLAIGNPALLDAFLRLGVALGELRCRAGRCGAGAARPWPYPGQTRCGPWHKRPSTTTPRCMPGWRRTFGAHRQTTTWPRPVR